MANHLPIDKKILIISMLCEGSSISGVGRITGVHLDTIMRLGVRIGQGCKALMDAKMKNLHIDNVQVDELWGFIKAKQKTVNAKGLGPNIGSIWTWVALDADTKLVPCFAIGDRDLPHAMKFIGDLKSRINSQPQISSDSLRHYQTAIEHYFGCEVDYATVVKSFPHANLDEERRYSMPDKIQITKKKVQGKPDMELCSTSYVEKQNHTIRMHCRRLSRLTNAFSKKRENFEAAVALHYAYYNFCKRHITIRCTPAMEAGIEKSQWSVADLIEITELKKT